MSSRAVTPDYYAVLQVHPDADYEVIKAAYRQLMKKHHPDMVGGDQQRARALNEAFRVLSDPEKRRRYDLDRIVVGTIPPPTSTRRPASPPPPPTPRPSPPAPEATAAPVVVQPAPETPWYLAPFTLLSAAYYLLPGTYEWESGSGRDLLTVILLPPLALAGFLLVSGRLAPLLGNSFTANMAAWIVLALFGLIAARGTLPRLVLAAGPTLMLLSGWLNPYLDHAHIPIVIAWGLLSSLSLILAARLYVFGVLPSLALIWLVARSI